MSKHLRIVSGYYRSHRLNSPKQDSQVRPTKNQVKETLFNWLQDRIYNAYCLDAFAGSGVLGFEAISNGAFYVTFIEKNHLNYQTIQQNVHLLNCYAQCSILCQNFFKYANKANAQSYDIIFLDPPFALNYIMPSLQIIHKHHLLNQNGVIYIETQSKTDIDALIHGFPYKKIKHKCCGDVQFALVTYAHH